jgi:hypothetical protein
MRFSLFEIMLGEWGGISIFSIETPLNVRALLRIEKFRNKWMIGVLFIEFTIYSR